MSHFSSMFVHVNRVNYYSYPLLLRILLLRIGFQFAVPAAAISPVMGAATSWGSTPTAKIAATLTSLWRARLRDGLQWDSQRHLIWYDTIFRSGHGVGN